MEHRHIFPEKPLSDLILRISKEEFMQKLFLIFLQNNTILNSNQFAINFSFFVIASLTADLDFRFILIFFRITPKNFLVEWPKKIHSGTALAANSMNEDLIHLDLQDLNFSRNKSLVRFVFYHICRLAVFCILILNFTFVYFLSNYPECIKKSNRYLL